MEMPVNSASNKENEISGMLRRQGITPTFPRVKIASALFARPQHVSADQVLALTNETGKPVSKATVYNTLGLFVRKKLIRELIVDSNRVFYDTSTHPHFHFYNVETEELSDVESDQVAVTLPAELPAGTELANVEVVFHIRPSSR
jgi:Fur family iron response transcriptional regulator